MRCKTGFSLYGRAYGYAGGSPDTSNTALEEFRKSGYRFKELMVTLSAKQNFQISGRVDDVANNH